MFQWHCKGPHMRKTVCTALTPCLSLVTAHLRHSNFCIFHHNLDLTPPQLILFLLSLTHGCYVVLKQVSLIAATLHGCLTGDETAHRLARPELLYFWSLR